MEYKNVFDDRYGYPGVFEIFRCQNCNHRFCTPPLDSSQLATVYSYYGRKATDSASVQEAAKKSSKVSRFSRYLIGANNQGQNFAPTRSILLDVGSGDCANLLEAQMLGHDAVGFDVDEQTNRIARDLSLEVKIGQSALDVFGERTFSWIQLNQVIEHLLEPEQELTRLGTLLDNDGRIFIATPNVNSLYRFLFQKRWINWHVPFHQHHFSKDSLKMLASKTNMKIESLRTVTPNVWAQLQFATLLTRQTKGSPSRLWSKEFEHEIPRRDKCMRIVLKFASLILSPFIVVVLRLVDWIGLGDCHVVILRNQA